MAPRRTRLGNLLLSSRSDSRHTACVRAARFLTIRRFFFYSADTDRSGDLSRKEIKDMVKLLTRVAGMEPHTGDKKAEEITEAIFKEADGDHNNSIDKVGLPGPAQSPWQLCLPLLSPITQTVPA